MHKNVLIILINTNSSEACLDTLEEISRLWKKTCKVLLVDNGVTENNLKTRHKDYSVVEEYLSLPEACDEAVVINQIHPTIQKYKSENIYIVTNDHLKTVSHLPVLISMSELSDNSVLGIRGGSVFSAFFHNFSFFQTNTTTDWLDFNGMLAPFDMWKEFSLLDLKYFLGFHQVDFGRKLTDKGYKLFKLKSHSLKKTKGLNNYFRMRNPYMFMKTYYKTMKYFWGGLYFIIQLPYSIFHYSKDKNYLNGLIDGIRLLPSKNPSNTS